MILAYGTKQNKSKAVTINKSLVSLDINKMLITVPIVQMNYNALTSTFSSWIIQLEWRIVNDSKPELHYNDTLFC